MGNIIPILPNAPRSCCQDFQFSVILFLLQQPKKSMKSLGFHKGLGGCTSRIVHTSLAGSQPHNMCSGISIESHRAQSTSIGTWRSLSLVFDGRMFLHARQMKLLILFGHFKLQIAFQVVVIGELSKHWPLSWLVRSL
ncbi:hypothetical protein ACB092_03G086600 [Castanea dentata]